MPSWTGGTHPKLTRPPGSSQPLRPRSRRFPAPIRMSWWGLLPLTSTEPVVPPGGTVYVSPSKVEAVQKSPLDWFVQAAGGEAATDFARSLGTLVHAIAQDLPEASGSEYVAELVRRWPALGHEGQLGGRLDFQRAEAMVRKLAQYVLVMRSEGRCLVGVEQDFAVQLPDLPDGLGAPDHGTTAAVPSPEVSARSAVLRGQVDRLEIDAEGRLVVVDLKTGKRQPGKTELARHPQLGRLPGSGAGRGLRRSTRHSWKGQRPAVPSWPSSARGTKGPAVQQQDPWTRRRTGRWRW